MRSIFFFLLYLSLQIAVAQPETTSEHELIGTIFEEMTRDTLPNSFYKERLDVIPIPGSDVVGDSLLREKYLESLKEYYTYRIWGYKHRHQVFKWQLTSSKIVFFAVILLLIASIYFSGVQFHKSMSTNNSSVTDIEATLKGIKVSSPVLGVIILVISLLFFYLYLVHIYPISEIF